MDELRFDTLTRTISSRRSALAGVLGGVAAMLGRAIPEEADAHDALERCRQIRNSVGRRRCQRRAREHNRRHRYCRNAARREACENRDCGIVRDSCGHPVSCGAPGGGCYGRYTCLPGNGACAATCIAPGRPCELEGCECGVEAETGNLFCVISEENCEVGTPCTTNSNCPASQMCGLNECSPGGSTTKRCRSLCG